MRVSFGNRWGALREAEVSELSMTDTVSRCTFEFTTEDLDAILSRSIFEVCNVQVSVADA